MERGRAGGPDQSHIGVSLKLINPGLGFIPLAGGSGSRKMGPPIKGHIGGVGKSSRITDVRDRVTILTAGRIVSRAAGVRLKNEIITIGRNSRNLRGETDSDPLKMRADLIGS